MEEQDPKRKPSSQPRSGALQDEASLLSRAVFWWVFSLLKLGKRKTVVAEDIPGLTKEHQSVVLAKRLRECFQRERAAQDKHACCVLLLLTAAAAQEATAWDDAAASSDQVLCSKPAPPNLLPGKCHSTYSVSILAVPQQQQLTAAVSAGTTVTVAGAGAAATTVEAATAPAVAQQQQLYSSCNSGTRFHLLRAHALAQHATSWQHCTLSTCCNSQGTYARCTRTSTVHVQQVMASALHILQALALGWLLQYLQKGTSSGIPGALTGYVVKCSSHVINLATTDVERFLLVGIFWPYLWEAPLETLVILYFGIRIVGVAFLSAMAALALLIPLQGGFSSRFAKLRAKVARLTDERVKLTSQAASTARRYMLALMLHVLTATVWHQSSESGALGCAAVFSVSAFALHQLRTYLSGASAAQGQSRLKQLHS
eukprot:17935-Heterococcus_DN1.PRE.1